MHNVKTVEKGGPRKQLMTSVLTYVALSPPPRSSLCGDDRRVHIKKHFGLLKVQRLKFYFIFLSGFFSVFF